MSCSCNFNHGKNCIKKVPIFSSLSPEEMEEVYLITGKKSFKKSDVVIMEGDINSSLYVINKGRVKVVKLSYDGREQIIRTLGPGDFLGEFSIFNPRPYKNNIEALEETLICEIKADKLRELIEKYPSISLKLIQELSMRLEDLEDQVKDISLNTTEKRLAKFILNANSGGQVQLNIRKKDLASYLGMTGETLSRKLKDFQKLGLISQPSSKLIIIEDLNSLSDIIIT